MLQSEFEALKDGDKVVYNGVRLEYVDALLGEVIIREESWLDCGSSVRFNHSHSFDFFAADQVEFIKEVE